MAPLAQRPGSAGIRKVQDAPLLLTTVESALAQPGAGELDDGYQRLIAKGEALRGAGRFRDAAAVFQQASLIRPNAVAAMDGVALSLAKLRDPDAAGWAQRALLQQPNQAMQHAVLGDVLVLLNRPREALAAYQRAVELDPTKASYRNGLCNVLLSFRRGKEALPHAKRAIELAPTNPAAHRLYARALLRCSPTSAWRSTAASREAEEHLRKALALNPSDPASQNQLAWFLRNRMRYREAREAFTSALRNDPTFKASQLGMNDWRTPDSALGWVARLALLVYLLPAPVKVAGLLGTLVLGMSLSAVVPTLSDVAAVAVLACCAILVLSTVLARRLGPKLGVTVV